MIWVYGICDRPDLSPPRRRGLAQAPLDGVREGDLLAVVTRHGRPVGEPAPDALWAHERVVERLMTDRTVLPMRFGSTVATDGELRAFMASSRGELEAALARVAGCVELGVRVLRPAPAAVAVGARTANAGSGRDYLLGKLRDGRHESRAVAALHDPLAALAVDARLRTGRSPDELLSGAYLVERPGVGRFRAAVQRLQATDPRAAILCTGPWPPYSFVRDVTR